MQASGQSLIGGSNPAAATDRQKMTASLSKTCEPDLEVFVGKIGAKASTKTLLRARVVLLVLATLSDAAHVGLILIVSCHLKWPKKAGFR